MMVMTNHNVKVCGFVSRPLAARREVAFHWPRQRPVSLPDVHGKSRLFMTTSNSGDTSLSLSSSSPLLTFAPAAYPNHPYNSANMEQPHPIRTVAAPMVAASDYAFRCLVRQYSHVDLCFTQMLHARNIMDHNTFLTNHLDLYEYAEYNHHNRNDMLPQQQQQLLPSQQAFLKNAHENDSLMAAADNAVRQSTTASSAPYGPVVVQLAGHDPHVVVQAALVILEHVPHIAGIDLNCGCPQAIARKGQYGSFLMEGDNGVTASRMLSALRQALPPQVYVSTKIRLPACESDLSDRMQRLVQSGIDFMTIHGRTLHENKTKVRECHTDRIRQAVQLVQGQHRHLPIIANGGIEFLPDVQQCLLETGASAVMSSEGLLETPNLFAVDSSPPPPPPQQHQQQLVALFARDRLEQQVQMTRDYLVWCLSYPPLPGVLGNESGSLSVARGHVFKMLHRYWQEHVDLRDRLGAKNDIQTLVQLWELVDTLYERYVGLTNAEFAALSSSQPSSSWYRRHWQANRREERRWRGSHDDVQLVQPTPPHGVNGNTFDNRDSLALEERKALIRERIAKLQREKRNDQLPKEPRILLS